MGYTKEYIKKEVVKFANNGRNTTSRKRIKRDRKEKKRDRATRTRRTKILLREMGEMVKLDLTEEETNLVLHTLSLNYIYNNLEEYKNDKDFYNELKTNKKIATRIKNKIQNNKGGGF